MTPERRSGSTDRRGPAPGAPRRAHGGVLGGGRPGRQPGAVPQRHPVRAAPGDLGPRGGAARRRTTARRSTGPATARPRNLPPGSGAGGARRARRPRSVRRRPLRRAGCLRWGPVRARHGAGRPGPGHRRRGRGGIGPWIVLDEPLTRTTGERPLVERALRPATTRGRRRAAPNAGRRGVRLVLARPHRRGGRRPASSRGVPAGGDRVAGPTEPAPLGSGHAATPSTSFDGYVRDDLSWGTTWDLDLGRLAGPLSTSGTATPTGWCPRATGSGFVTSCPTPGSRSAPARATATTAFVHLEEMLRR